MTALALALVAGGDVREEMKAVEDNLKEVRVELKRLKKRRGGLVEELALLERQVVLETQALDMLEEQRDTLASDLGRAERALSEATRRYGALSEKARGVVVALYKLPRMDLLRAVLQFRSVLDAYRRARALHSLFSYQRALMDELARTNERLGTLLAEKRETAARLDSTLALTEERAERLSQAKAERETTLAAIEKERTEKEKQLAALKKQRARLSALLAKLAKKAKKRPKVGKIPARLSPPVEGKVVGRFGEVYSKRYRTKVRNNGVDIAAPAKSPVKACAAGKVVYAGWFEGYGNTVIIEHKGFFSVYANLRSIGVTKGKRVLSSTTVGSVGEKPLHFELRVGSVAVDPEDYL